MLLFVLLSCRRDTLAALAATNADVVRSENEGKDQQKQLLLLRDKRRATYSSSKRRSASAVRQPDGHDDGHEKRSAYNEDEAEEDGESNNERKQQCRRLTATISPSEIMSGQQRIVEEQSKKVIERVALRMKRCEFCKGSFPLCTRSSENYGFSIRQWKKKKSGACRKCMSECVRREQKFLASKKKKCVMCGIERERWRRRNRITDGGSDSNGIEEWWTRRSWVKGICNGPPSFCWQRVVKEREKQRRRRLSVGGIQSTTTVCPNSNDVEEKDVIAYGVSTVPN